MAHISPISDILGQSNPRCAECASRVLAHMYSDMYIILKLSISDSGYFGPFQIKIQGTYHCVYVENISPPTSEDLLTARKCLPPWTIGSLSFWLKDKKIDNKIT